PLARATPRSRRRRYAGAATTSRPPPAGAGWGCWTRAPSTRPRAGCCAPCPACPRPTPSTASR
ncbi:unnamed protein product, partial [Heterosigma akashiwo]